MNINVLTVEQELNKLIESTAHGDKVFQDQLRESAEVLDDNNLSD